MVSLIPAKQKYKQELRVRENWKICINHKNDYEDCYKSSDGQPR